MKIAIVGKGTSSIITALVCISKGHDVEIFYDPKTPHISVGESTTPHIAEIIKDVLNLCIGELVDSNIVSYKNGIRFINWGKGNQFRHHFQTNLAAFHFESGEFNPFMHQFLEKNGVKYHPVRVDNYEFDGTHVIVNDEKYDFIISCSGWSETDEYKKPIVETVNSAILHIKDSIIDPTYTLHEATEDGWQFGLPFPERNITKHGYLFNRNQISEENALKKLKKENSKVITWDPKYCKRIIQNRYSAYNGNRLMFFEPLQALSLLYYRQFAEMICNFLEDIRYENYLKINQNYLELMMEYQLSLSWHYSYGSVFNSEFWNNIVQKTEWHMNLIPRGNRDLILSQYYHDKKFEKPDFLNIGVFQYQDFMQIDYGMTGKYINLINEFNGDRNP